MSDTVREGFEFWYSDEGTWPKAVEKDEKGRYRLAGATAAWDAWKAGGNWQREQDALICDREAVKHRKAPTVNDYYSCDDARGEACEELADAIRHPIQAPANTQQEPE